MRNATEAWRLVNAPGLPDLGFAIRTPNAGYCSVVANGTKWRSNRRMAKIVGSRATSARTAAKQRLLSFIHVDTSPVGTRKPAPTPTRGSVVWAGGSPAAVAPSPKVHQQLGYKLASAKGDLRAGREVLDPVKLFKLSNIKILADSAAQREMSTGPVTDRPKVESVPAREANVSLEKPTAPSSDAHAQDTLEFTTWSSHLIVRRGISSKVLGPLAEYLGLSKADVADFLDLDRGTAHRRAQADQPLPTYAAEGLLRLLEIDRMARDVFATDEDVTGWLHKPHPMLDDQTPLVAAKTSFGAEKVKELLTAMKWGGVL